MMITEKSVQLTSDGIGELEMENQMIINTVLEG